MEKDNEIELEFLVQKGYVCQMEFLEPQEDKLIKVQTKSRYNKNMDTIAQLQ